MQWVALPTITLPLTAISAGKDRAKITFYIGVDLWYLTFEYRIDKHGRSKTFG